MNKQELLRRTKTVASARGIDYRVVDLDHHIGVVVGHTRTTISRNTEVADGTASAFFTHFEIELGKLWWR